MKKAWENHDGRYDYVVEEEFENIGRRELNDLETHYIINVRKTFNDINSYGMNFDTGGTSNGKLSGETLVRYSKASKKKWSNIEYKEKLVKQRNQIEYRKKLSIATKKAMNDPIIKKRTVKAREALLKTPEYRKKLSDSVSKALNREEIREKFKGKNNYRYNGYYVIPDNRGKLKSFDSVSDASIFSGLTRQLLYKYCRTHNNKKIQKKFQKVAEYIGVESIVGMSPYDMGFKFVKNNKEKQ